MIYRCIFSIYVYIFCIYFSYCGQWSGRWIHFFRGHTLSLTLCLFVIPPWHIDYEISGRGSRAGHIHVVRTVRKLYDSTARIDTPQCNALRFNLYILILVTYIVSSVLSSASISSSLYFYLLLLLLFISRVYIRVARPCVERSNRIDLRESERYTGTNTWRWMDKTVWCMAYIGHPCTECC